MMFALFSLNLIYAIWRNVPDMNQAYSVFIHYGGVTLVITGAQN